MIREGVDSFLFFVLSQYLVSPGWLFLTLPTPPRPRPVPSRTVPSHPVPSCPIPPLSPVPAHPPAFGWRQMVELFGRRGVLLAEVCDGNVKYARGRVEMEAFCSLRGRLFSSPFVTCKAYSVLIRSRLAPEIFWSDCQIDTRNLWEDTL